MHGFHELTAQEMDQTVGGTGGAFLVELLSFFMSLFKGIGGGGAGGGGGTVNFNIFDRPDFFLL